MSLLWRTAATLSLDPEEHHEHALHPAFEAAGIRHAPCALLTCPDYDEDHNQRLEAAWAMRKRAKPEEIDLRTTPLYGMESHADTDTILRYVMQPKEGFPKIVRDQGRHYLLDGHHSTAAAMLRGDTHLKADVTDLDALSGGR